MAECEPFGDGTSRPATQLEHFRTRLQVGFEPVDVAFSERRLDLLGPPVPA